MSKQSPRYPLSRLALACALSLGLTPAAHAVYDWNWTTITNNNWEIQLTDFGYSDYLFDQTPGFEGREYLSGEWGAAVAYGKGEATQAPTWLEPRFSYPNWDTNSNFSVIQAMTTGTGANGLPTAMSIIGNGDIQITQNISFVDTLVGTPMGWKADSTGGAGMALSSNRYVMLQSYSITNTSGETLNNLQFFQLLHGLSSQTGVFDSRSYAGQLSDFRYDITLGGDAGYGSGPQYDYIGFSAQVAPNAIELGHYGIEGIDDHGMGKPGTGTHLSVESNSLNGSDAFPADEPRWVAGAARWDMANTLAPGETVTMDVMLTILTGWQVSADTDSGTGNGGGGEGTGYPPGTVGYEFQGSHSAGQFFFEYEAEDWSGILQMVSLGEFGLPAFQAPGGQFQLFDIEFDGEFDGQIKLTFSYDDTLFPAGFDEHNLHVYHWTGSAWEDLAGIVNVDANTITAYTNSLSPFAVAAAVPEPGTYALFLAGLGLLGYRINSRRKSAR